MTAGDLSNKPDRRKLLALFLLSLLVSCLFTTVAYIIYEPRLFTFVVEKRLRDPNFVNPPAVNNFMHIDHLVGPEFRQVVLPNCDTLYSSAWLDLSHGPVVLSVPETQGRYYLIQMLDVWTNVFASIGKRTTGTSAKKFMIVGPDWNGTVPNEYEKIQSPTIAAWVIGRTLVAGPDDTPAAVKLMHEYSLTPYIQTAM